MRYQVIIKSAKGVVVFESSVLLKQRIAADLKQGLELTKAKPGETVEIVELPDE